MLLKRLNIETLLFALVAILSLWLHLYRLGSAPLNDVEASWAMQSAQVAQPAITDQPFQPGPQPAYVFLTGAGFALFGSSNFLARFWPALAGFLLTLLPICLRRELGRPAALILALGLALDPGLNAISRQAGGPMMAIGFSLLGLGLWRMRQPGAAALFGAVGLLSGPAVLPGAAGLALAFLVDRYLSRRRSTQPAAPIVPRKILVENRPLFLTLLVGVIFLGTAFLRFPQGIAAWLASLPAYLQGWFSFSGISASRLLAALLFYETIPLLFALLAVASWFGQRVSMLRSSTDKDGQQRFLLLWAGASLGLALLYPARQVSDLGWTLVPLWILAASHLASYLPSFGRADGDNPDPDSPEEMTTWPTLLEAGLVLILAILLWNTLIATSAIEPLPGISWDIVRLLFMAGIISLGALITALISLGWSWSFARNGLILGILFALGIYTVAVMWGATILRPGQPVELWYTPPAAGDADLILATIGDLSEADTGFRQHAQIVSTVDAPSLRWLLRHYPNARFTNDLSPAANLPAIILTQGGVGEEMQVEPPPLPAAYRGQDFAWWIHPAWGGVLPPDQLGWITFRKAPQDAEQIILWARGDLFPGGSLLPQSAPNIP